MQNKDDHELRRGPFIGNIEVEKRRFLIEFEHKNHSITCSNVCAAIVEYFERYEALIGQAFFS
jgi:hypothetical protein